MPDNLKVLFLSPEAVPFAKTGGLADVAGSLPNALVRLGVDVDLMLPFYRVVREGGFEPRLLLKDLKVALRNSELTAQVLGAKTEDGLSVYFIEREDLYDRPNLYGTPLGDYYDNLERFAFFAHAAMETATTLSLKPDVIHCHDWQTGLVPALLKGPYRDSTSLGAPATVFTIHNLGYPGLFPAEKLSLTGLSRNAFFHPEGLEYYGKISLLKAGIVYSDAITTVSPAYAKEIQSAEYGMGMEGILRHRRAHLQGILNGVDYSLWDPSQDLHIPAHYSPRKMAGKQTCKESLILEMGLNPALAKRPVLGMVSRLDVQKGLDLLVQILDDILSLDVGLVILGSGDEQIQQAIQQAAQRYPGRISLKIGFDEPLAHRIMAGADIFLSPSRYEPCGLTQMYALKYGTVPVVRATGGLEDTIVQFISRTARGNGFKFRPYKAAAFLQAIREAVALFTDLKAWRKLTANGMKADFSWEQSARKYLELYKSLLEG
ncbi:MAG: glycogen synthase GlgA [Deltaproteobacteria bacterium]|nr:MAG: glycogen synthase GlgA [Deltaproteobacteria bacterium]